MTLAARNIIFVLGVIVTFLLLLVYAFAGYSLLLGRYADAVVRVSQHQSWFGLSWEVAPIAAYRSLAAAGILGVVSSAGVATAARLFRRVSSAEIYFVTLFMITLSVELFRIGQPFVALLDLPAVVSVTLTRVVLFGRLVGALALFTAGIYAAGADYPRIGSVTLLFAALSFLIVYLVPVDADRMYATYVNVAGGRAGIDLMLAFLSLGAVVNYAIGWRRGHRERAGAVALSVLGFVIGKELVLHVPSLLALSVGLGLLAAATMSFVLVNRSYYLWY